MKTVAFVRTTNIYDDSRATKEIAALLEGGYKVVVLGWDRNGEAEEKTKQVFRCQNFECRFFHCILQSGIGIRNVHKLLKWFYWTKRELIKINDLYAVHACNLDGGYGPYDFCKKEKIPFIYDIYDYYVDSHSIPKRVKGIVEKIETRIINYARVTIICTEERREQIKKASPKSVRVIYNSPDVPDMEPTEEEYDYAYCGSLCDKRLIKEILDKYQDHTELKMVFAGNDKYKADVERIAKRYDKIDFFGTVPYCTVLEIEKKAKVLSAIYEPSIRNHQLSAPNKFYEAMALGKPVIVCKGTGIDVVVEENKIGLAIPYDVDCFYSALDELLSDPQKAKEMGSRGRKVYVEKFQWCIMKELLLSIYCNLE